MPPTSMVGSVTRTERWSVVQRKVAKDWMKKSSPPVARSWLMGGLPRMGVMMSRCTRDAEQRAEHDRGQPGQPQRPAVELTRKYTPYMHSTTRST